MERLASYANEHGAESGWPCFSLDEETWRPAKNGVACGTSRGTCIGSPTSGDLRRYMG